MNQGTQPLATRLPGQHALVEQADADQHDAEADEGQRAQHAFQLRHVEQEHLGDGDHDQRAEARRSTCDLRQHAADQQRHAERQPERRIGVGLELAEARARRR